MSDIMLTAEEQAIIDRLNGDETDWNDTDEKGQKDPQYGIYNATLKGTRVSQTQAGDACVWMTLIDPDGVEFSKCLTLEGKGLSIAKKEMWSLGLTTSRSRGEAIQQLMGIGKGTEITVKVSRKGDFLNVALMPFRGENPTLSNSGRMTDVDPLPF